MQTRSFAQTGSSKLPLQKGKLEPGASGNLLQVSHRKEAIRYALVGARMVRCLAHRKIKGDPVGSEMESIMGKWVAETIYQAAYLREYHLWEKDCRAYFRARFRRLGREMPKHGSGPFTHFIGRVVDLFEVTLDPSIIAELGEMRAKAVQMKHADGLTLADFITAADYRRAIEAIDHFWLVLSKAERVSG